MADRNQLTYLLKLLDDNSPAVQEAVLAELSTYGSTLEEDLVRAGWRPIEGHASALHELIDEQRRIRLQKEWHSWFGLPDDTQKLETAMSLIADFQNGRAFTVSLTPLLDELSGECRSHHRYPDALGLATFLFESKQLAGAPENDYYNPLNSNLVSVIERKRGIPISLACIYILVGHRLGLDIRGCNFPGHFLALARTKGRTLVVDCYNGGRILTKEDLSGINASVSLKDIQNLECDATIIIARVLRNLINAYERTGDNSNVELLKGLLKNSVGRRNPS